MEASSNPDPRNPQGDTVGSFVIYVLLFFVVCVALGCFLFFRSGQLGEAEREAEYEIRSVLTDQVEAWNRGDLDGFMAGYWHSDELSFCSGGDVTKGWQPTLDRYRKRYQAPGSEMGQLKFDDVTVEVLTADTALVRGRWALTRSKDAPHGLYTLEVKKFADGWKVVYDHTSAADK